MATLSHISPSPTPYYSQPVEIVERKGIGHPDTICDALAEELSRTLCQFYLDNFGLILHHNVDKALLWGGISQPKFGGGKIISPMEIFLAGRATNKYKGVNVPIEDLVEQSCTNWLRSNFHVLDPEHHVKLHSLIRPGSSDLVELYLRQEATGIALANDTSCGVGYAPLSEMERIVLQVEQTLNSVEVKTAHPETGEDIKVMAIRRYKNIELTISCAFVDRYIADADDYVQKKLQLARLVEKTAATVSNRNINVTVNAADNVDTGSLFMTVTGTSAESGDDGEVGRGNRVNGLITPYRPMNMEAAAGKNPVTHVGKLYNIVAQQIASSLVQELDEVAEAYCYLVSRIGSPIKEPMIVDIRVSFPDDGDIDTIQKPVDEIVTEKLENMDAIRQMLLSGAMVVY
ncbi:MAG: methionine adenosyltransferase [Gammaproteobacteria bacterium]|nr:methionine adenosyltransferase [Gammaproteobacteria bacterium]